MPAAWCLMLGATLLWAGSTEAGTRLRLGGKWVDVSVEAPEFPSSRDECNQFRTETQELQKQVNDAHSACLEDNKGNHVKENRGSCSHPACQDLHTARDDIGKALSTGFNQCMSAVAERERSERWGSGSSSTNTFEAFKAALAKGPVSAVRRLVKQEIDDIIDKTFSYGAPAVKKGLNTSLAAGFLAKDFMSLQAACKTKSDKALNECNKEMLSTIHSLASKVPSRMRADPGVVLIQQAMLERLNLVVQDTYGQMEKLNEQIDEVTSDDAPPRSKRTRRTPLIENR